MSQTELVERPVRVEAVLAEDLRSRRPRRMRAFHRGFEFGAEAVKLRVPRNCR